MGTYKHNTCTSPMPKYPGKFWLISWLAPLAIAWVVFCTRLQVSAADHRRYTVGDDAGWDAGVNYSIWTTGKSFYVGDSLYFGYIEADHNVLQVGEKTFETCAMNASIRNYTAGDTTVHLGAAGMYYFVCGIGDHCLEGQKLQLFVYLQPAATPAAALDQFTPGSTFVSQQSASHPSNLLLSKLQRMLLFGCTTLAIACITRHLQAPRPYCSSA